MPLTSTLCIQSHMTVIMTLQASKESIEVDHRISLNFEHPSTPLAGTYDLTVMNPQREVLYMGVVGVQAAPVLPTASVVILQKAQKQVSVCEYIFVSAHGSCGCSSSTSVAHCLCVDTPRRHKSR